VQGRDGTTIAFEKTGSGPAVIIVAGALTHRHIYRDKYTSLTEKLSKHFTTYIYDRRGRGETTHLGTSLDRWRAGRSPTPESARPRGGAFVDYRPRPVISGAVIGVSEQAFNGDVDIEGTPAHCITAG
jgi:hypothetical protein